MFGPGGSPSSHFRKDLKVLLDLDDEAWEVLANWFLTTNDFDSEQARGGQYALARAVH